MIPDILIIHDSAGFHLLHGHLHLAAMLGDIGSARVDVQGHGSVLVSWSGDGLVVETNGTHLPLLAY